MTNITNFGKELDRIDANVKSILAIVTTISTQENQALTVLADLQAADAAIKMAVQNAVTLIMSLHTGAGSVSDAEVEAVVADLNAASAALAAATPAP